MSLVVSSPGTAVVLDRMFARTGRLIVIGVIGLSVCVKVKGGQREGRPTTAQRERRNDYIPSFELLDPLPNLNDLPKELVSKGEVTIGTFLASVEMQIGT